jgi:hypothetical protein
MPIELIVKSPFGNYTVGQHITDQEEIQMALEKRPMDVIKIMRPVVDEPAQEHDEH